MTEGIYLLPTDFEVLTDNGIADSVDHNKLWKILKKMGIPDHLTLPLEKSVCRSGSNS